MNMESVDGHSLLFYNSLSVSNPFGCSLGGGGGVVFVFRLIRRVRVRTELSKLLFRTVTTFVAQLTILLRLMIHTDPMRSPIPRPLALFPRLDHRH
jgi:hypothetical protein